MAEPQRIYGGDLEVPRETRSKAPPEYVDPDDEALTPEEEAAKIWPVYRDADGYPIEFQKEPWVSRYHIHECARVTALLQRHFVREGLPATVEMDTPVIWERLPRRAFPVKPDVMVVRDLVTDMSAWGPEDLTKDEAYRLWQNDGRVPDFALEVSSGSTWKNDLSRKPKGKLTKYESLGIREYLVADLHARWVKPPLRLWRREAGELVEQPADDRGRFWLRTLELEVALQGEHLEFYRKDGTRLPDPDEELLEAEERVARESERASRESERAARESERARRLELERKEADARIAALERELERLRGNRS